MSIVRALPLGSTVDQTTGIAWINMEISMITKLGRVSKETRSCNVLPFLASADSTPTKVRSWIKTIGVNKYYCEFNPGSYTLADGQSGRPCATATFVHDCTK